jgi:hypothetical protein
VVLASQLERLLKITLAPLIVGNLVVGDGVERTGGGVGSGVGSGLAAGVGVGLGDGAPDNPFFFPFFFPAERKVNSQYVKNNSFVLLS